MTLYCSFCGASQHDVKKLIANQGARKLICDNCVDKCNDIIRKDGKVKRDLPRPEDILQELDKTIIGQDRAKRVMIVGTRNHMKRLINNSKKRVDVELSKSNIMLIGPTGTGKTLLAREIAKQLDVPFVSVDATTLSQSGYYGEDADSVIWKLYRAAGNNVERAQRGVIYIDEIDKIAARHVNTRSGRDVGGEGVQESLLQLIEGKKISMLEGKDHLYSAKDPKELDTSEILFICGGSFAGMERIIAERLEGGVRMGFHAAAAANDDWKTNNIFRFAEPEDFIRFGMLPEFIGRAPIIVSTDSHDPASLRRILLETPGSPTRQQQALLGMSGIQLIVEDEAYDAIAQQAYRKGTGARGLKTIVEGIFRDVTFEEVDGSDARKIVILREEHVLRGERPPAFDPPPFELSGR